MSWKKILLYGLTFIFLVTIAPNTHYYPKTARVYAIDGNLVTVVDSHRAIWKFWGADGYYVNELVSMLMFDCFTPSIYDDTIIKVRHAHGV